MQYLLIAITIAGNVIAMLLVKKTVMDAGQAPSNTGELIPFFLKMILNPLTWLAAVAVFAGLSAFWLALTKMELGRIYPVIGSLSYVLVALFATLFFKENITTWGWAGIVLVVAGAFMLLH